jgi:methylated-DNA-protein-cysteine methyltransferase related protein
MASSTYERIWAAVRRIPRGRVSTYGWVAEMAGVPGAARQVGYAMHALPPHTTVPWHRVINAQGRVSLRAGGDPRLEQRFLLEAEGVVFDAGGRVSLERFGWRGGKRRKRGVATDEA